MANITWSQVGRGRATRCLSVDTTRAASSPASGTIWPDDPGGGREGAQCIHYSSTQYPAAHRRSVTNICYRLFFFFSFVCSHTTVCFSANNKWRGRSTYPQREHTPTQQWATVLWIWSLLAQLPTLAAIDFYCCWGDRWQMHNFHTLWIFNLTSTYSKNVKENIQFLSKYELIWFQSQN